MEKDKNFPKHILNGKEKIGDIKYLNKNCWLVKTLNYSSYKRCLSCESKFRNCLFLHYQIISLLLIFFLLGLSFLIEGKISKLIIISVFTLVIVYGYLFNQSTDKIIQANFTQKKTSEALEELNEELENRIKQRTENLRKANKQLKNLDKVKSEFISIASHQLRTPLTVIKGYLSMILEGDFGKVEPKQQDPLNKVYLSGEQMIQLVNDFLSISRIEADRLEFNYEMTNLENMVNNIVDDLKKTIKQKNLSLKYIKSSEQLPLVKIDQEKMRQTIINVIDNAIKYTRQGNITVSLKMVDGKIQFCVSDSGAGISQDDLPMLFKKFSRGKTISKMYTEGTGLGLYVARKMVEAHKGKMWAESEGENKDSQIYFQLPVD